MRFRARGYGFGEEVTALKGFRDEKLDGVGANEGDGYDGVTEDMRTRPGEQAAEVVGGGFSGRQHGGSDGDDVRWVGERWLSRRREVEGV